MTPEEKHVDNLVKGILYVKLAAFGWAGTITFIVWRDVTRDVGIFRAAIDSVLVLVCSIGIAYAYKFIKQSKVQINELKTEEILDD